MRNEKKRKRPSFYRFKIGRLNDFIITITKGGGDYFYFSQSKK